MSTSFANRCPLFFSPSNPRAPSRTDSSVLETLATTDGNRKCFRLIGGTLVERTVDEVKPGLVSTRDGIKTVISGLAEQYKAKEKELAEFQRKHNIQLKNPNQR